MKKDTLSPLLEELLENAGQLTSFEEVVHEAVALEIHRMMSDPEFFVPEREWDDIEIFLKEEAHDLLRKKTYGYLSLEEYRKSLKKNCN